MELCDELKKDVSEIAWYQRAKVQLKKIIEQDAKEEADQRNQAEEQEWRKIKPELDACK